MRNTAGFNSLTIGPRDEDREAYLAAERAFQSESLRQSEAASACEAQLVVGGLEIDLPADGVQLLRFALRMLASGRDITVTPTDRELSSIEAARLLSVSRQYLVRLCDGGKIPYRMEGTHRRLALDDVITYRNQRNKERQERLRELIATTAEAGEYDLSVAWPPEE